MKYAIYTVGLYLMGLGIRLASLWNRKAHLWTRGRRHWKRSLAKLAPKEPTLWCHCASHGEYLQARPVLQEWNRRFPDTPIILTFFSPSGMEHFEDHSLVSHVFYLPLDTIANARSLINSMTLEAVLFIKSEIWPNLWRELYRHDIPVLQIAASYPQGSRTLRNSFLRKQLQKHAARILVQDSDSMQHLTEWKIDSVAVTGNPRVDEVLRIASTPFEDEILEDFCSEGKVLIMGSAWPEDFPCLQALFVEDGTWRIIIAPHEVHESAISKITKLIPDSINWQLYSSYIADDSRVLVMDTVGLLAKAYRYSQASYVGGGWGKGVHNTLEPAVYGIPVVIGPRHQGFPEVHQLQKAKVISIIADVSDAPNVLQHLDSPQTIRQSRKGAKSYFEENRGASQRTVDEICAYLQAHEQESI